MPPYLSKLSLDGLGRAPARGGWEASWLLGWLRRIIVLRSAGFGPAEPPVGRKVLAGKLHGSRFLWRACKARARAASVSHNKGGRHLEEHERFFRARR